MEWQSFCALLLCTGISEHLAFLEGDEGNLPLIRFFKIIVVILRGVRVMACL